MARVSIEVLAPNVTKVYLGSTTVLFSYAAPIAAWTNGSTYILDKAPTATTRRHMNNYGPDPKHPDVQTVSAEELDSLLAG